MEQKERNGYSVNDSVKTRREERDERMGVFLRHIDSGRDERRENSGRGGIRSHEEGGEPAQGGGTTLRIETYPTLPLSLVAQQAGRKGRGVWWCEVDVALALAQRSGGGGHQALCGRVAQIRPLRVGMLFLCL